MANPDPYAVLGLEPGATPREIEAAWRRLASRRPLPSGAERTAAEEAYLLLADPRRRSTHDRDRGLLPHPALAERSPWAARSFFDAGIRAMKRGRWELARESFRRAVDSQPWEAVYRSHLGLAMATAGGDTHRARDLCLEALQLEPDNRLARVHLARVYELAGLPGRARQVLEKGAL